MPSQFIKNYLSGLSTVISSVDPVEFEKFVGELKDAHERGSHIFICGNGGSASTASHFACDMNKGVSHGKDRRFRVICLNDNVPTMLAYANDVSYEDVFVGQLKNLLKKDDLVIGVSGSGNSNNILKYIDYANEHGGRTFGICGFGGGRLSQTARCSLVIKSDDMQKVEDLHLIVLHCAMQYFMSQKL